MELYNFAFVESVFIFSLPLSERIDPTKLKQETPSDDDTDKALFFEETMGKINPAKEEDILSPDKHDLNCKDVFARGGHVLSRRHSAIDFFNRSSHRMIDILQALENYASCFANDDARPLLDRLYSLGSFHEMKRFITRTFPHIDVMRSHIMGQIKRPLCIFLSRQAQHKLFTQLIKRVQHDNGGRPVSYHKIFATDIRTGREQISEALALTATRRERLYQRIFGCVPFTVNGDRLPDIESILPESVMRAMNHHKNRFDSFWAHMPGNYKTIVSKMGVREISQSEARYLLRYLNENIPAITNDQYTQEPLSFRIYIAFQRSPGRINAEYDPIRNEIVCYTHRNSSFSSHTDQPNWKNLFAHETWHAVQNLSYRHNHRNNYWNYRGFANNLEKTKEAIRKFSIAAMGRPAITSQSAAHAKEDWSARRSSIVESEGYYMAVR